MTAVLLVVVFGVVGWLLRRPVDPIRVLDDFFGGCR